MIDLGALRINIETNADKTKAELNEVGDTAEKQQSKFSKLGGAIKNGALIATGAITATVGTMAAFATKSAETADRVDKLSAKIGLSKKGFQEWDYVLGQNGASIEKMQTGMKTLNTIVGKGKEISNQALEEEIKLEEQLENGTITLDQYKKKYDELYDGAYDAIPQLKQLGISLAEIDNLSQEEMMEKVIMSLAEMENGSDKARLATELFGKAGIDMMPMLNGGAEAITELKNRAGELGLVMSDEAVTAGVVLGDTMDDVKKSFGMLGTEIGVAVMPIFQKFLEWILANLPKIKEDFGKVVDFIKNAIAILVKFWEENGTAIKAVTDKIFSAIKVIIDTTMNIIKNVIKVITGIIKGDWSTVWEGIKGIFSSAWEGMKNLLPMLLDGLFSILKGAFNIFKDLGSGMFNAVWDGIKNIWESISSWVSEKVSWLADKLAFWKKGNNEMSKDNTNTSNKTKVNGSHANGLDYVPYNGYIAELHRGERVLTAQEARNYNNTNTSNITINASLSDKINVQEVARELEKLIYREKRALGTV